MKVWISKYALTQGIYEVDAEVSEHTATMIIVTPNDRLAGVLQFFHHDQWHLTKELAAAKAEQMRKRKIKSLEKALATINALKF